MKLQPGLVMPGGMVPFGGSGGYAAFVAHISAKETPATVPWGNACVVGAQITTGAALSGNMYGSSFNDHFWVSSSNARVMQHCVSTETQINNIAANGRVCWMRVQNVAGLVDPWFSTNRNGYASLAESDGIGDPSYVCNLAIWWDETLGARQRNPEPGGAETAYIF